MRRAMGAKTGKALPAALLEDTVEEVAEDGGEDGGQVLPAHIFHA
jgi:hypothetical protein